MQEGKQDAHKLTQKVIETLGREPKPAQVSPDKIMEVATAGTMRGLAQTL